MSGVALRRLHGTAEDVALVQRLHERANDYVFNVSGLPPRPDEGARFFTDLPPGKTLRDKCCFAVLAGDACIGCIDLVRGWPDERTAIIGLLMLVPSARGHGHGEAALRGLEAEVRQWPEIDTLRIAVVASNAGALPFWRRMGFEPVGEPKPYVEGRVVSSRQPMQRALR